MVLKGKVRVNPGVATISYCHIRWQHPYFFGLTCCFIPTFLMIKLLWWFLEQRSKSKLMLAFQIHCTQIRKFLPFADLVFIECWKWLRWFHPLSSWNPIIVWGIVLWCMLSFHNFQFFCISKFVRTLILIMCCTQSWLSLHDSFPEMDGGTKSKIFVHMYIMATTVCGLLHVVLSTNQTCSMEVAINIWPKDHPVM